MTQETQQHDQYSHFESENDQFELSQARKEELLRMFLQEKQQENVCNDVEPKRHYIESNHG